MVVAYRVAGVGMAHPRPVRWCTVWGAFVGLP